ncbi:hypothetical protein HMPREF2626_01565 [Aerococcus sp. HMSC062A02]|nr:hypothetical protein HMPREF2626_01565 [Aerococcus sp. HMSC062A02]
MLSGDLERQCDPVCILTSKGLKEECIKYIKFLNGLGKIFYAFMTGIGENMVSVVKALRLVKSVGSLLRIFS